MHTLSYMLIHVSLVLNDTYQSSRPVSPNVASLNYCGLDPLSALHFIWLWPSVLSWILGDEKHPHLVHLCYSLSLHVFLSPHPSLLFSESSNTFLIGCRSANSWTWLNRLALSVSRQMGCSCSGYFSILKKKKKEEGHRKKLVCGRGWGEGGREIVLIRLHKRKPSFFLRAPSDRL